MFDRMTVMAPADVATMLHADLDAFYASVEQLLDPSLRGRAIAVGGGVVLAASYEARAFGVHAGMAGWQARRRCPGIRFVGGHFREYQRLGDEVMAVLHDFTPLVERISIDEAFVDVAGSIHLFGPPSAIALAIRRRVRDELGLPLSIGVARTKHLAKVASQVAKPDGLVVVEATQEQAFLAPLPVDLMWGVGPVTSRRLAEAGVRTIGELAAIGSPLVEHLLGSAVGAKLSLLAVNADPRRIETSRRAGSVGAQSALGVRDATPDLIRTTLAFLADRVAARLRAADRAGRTITVRVRFAGMRAVTRSITVPVALSTTLTLTELATELARMALADHSPALQLELALGLDDGAPRPGSSAGAARWGVDRSVDAIRARFGRDAVGYAAVTLSPEGRVPDAFRELAQHDLSPTPSDRSQPEDEVYGRN
jgi:DNA polymerase IV